MDEHLHPTGLRRIRRPGSGRRLDTHRVLAHPSAQIMRDFRLAQDLTQRELADLIGCTRGAIGNYERGSRKPDPLVALRFCDVAKKAGVEMSLEKMYDRRRGQQD